MARFRKEERLLGGSALVILGLLLILLVAAPTHKISWLALAVAGLAAVIALLLRDISLQSKARDSLAAEMDSKQEEVQRLALELTELDLVDPLTGARNRRGFIDLVEHQIKIAKREWSKLHFVIVDVDDMRLINEEFGQTAGDAALVEVVQTIWASSRTVDIVGRMGGDEFAVALIHADDPSVVADRIRGVLATRTRDADHPYELHVSVGMATYDPSQPASLDELIRAAHQALYEDKRAAAEARARKLAAPHAR